MREIKFRAWNKRTKRMLKSIFRFDKDGISRSGWEYMSDINTSGKKMTYEIMQFTGLKDKNGKEIYEGDIVKSFFDDGTYRTKAIVSFDKGRFCIDDNSNEVEIIGNIYENE